MAADPQTDDCAVELLLAVHPLIKLLGGNKRRNLQRAFAAMATRNAMQVLNIDEGRLPQNPRAAALSLLGVCVELAEAYGVTRPELVQYFNHRGEAGEHGCADDVDQALSRAIALFAMLAGLRQLERARDDDARLQERA